MTELNDQILLSRYLRGADDAFRHLLDRHSGLVYGTALRVTGDPDAAEEVSQDVFVLVARKARALTSHPSVAGWLHRTSHNVARHEQRRRMRQSRKVARIAEEIEEAQFDTPRALTGVDEAVARLPSLIAKPSCCASSKTWNTKRSPGESGPPNSPRASEFRERSNACRKPWARSNHRLPLLVPW